MSGVTLPKDIEDIRNIRTCVWAYYKKYGRHNLPWRHTQNPYRILVSEIMLQQTQVERVIPKYNAFLKDFPSVKKLAGARLRDVLRAWNGLGYNRRGIFLYDTAKKVVTEHGGQIPLDLRALLALPGVGDYTAKAVRVFACNESEILIETNIRTAIIHHFLKTKKQKIHDRDVAQYAHVLASGQDPRTWHWALMDYGAYVKKTHGNAAQKSEHYTQQATFEGSLRQARGAIVTALTQSERAYTARELGVRLGLSRGRTVEALRALQDDGILQKRASRWNIV